ncbi:MAG: hypothetical protein ACRDPJ_22430 [Nocardioidaceae bacterium]
MTPFPRQRTPSRPTLTREPAALLLIYDTFAEFEESVLLTALSGTSHTVTTFSSHSARRTRRGPGVADRGTRLAEMVVVDGNLVTATGSSYLAFAEEVLRLLDDGPDVAPLTFFREPSLA